MTHVEKAAELFKSGYNCSQSTAGAFAEELGMAPGDVCRMVMGFGGGFGRLREVCGGVSGMTFVISCLLGCNEADADKKAELYALIQQLAAEFKEKTGSIICRELLSLDKDAPTPSTPDARTQQYYDTRPCLGYVMTATQITEDALKQRGII